MAATTLTITGTFAGPDGTLTPGTGTVIFTPNIPSSTAHFNNGGTVCINEAWSVALIVGSLPEGFKVNRCPEGYMVLEEIDGLPTYGPYLVPDQAGPVDLSSYH